MEVLTGKRREKFREKIDELKRTGNPTEKSLHPPLPEAYIERRDGLKEMLGLWGIGKFFCYFPGIDLRWQVIIVDPKQAHRDGIIDPSVFEKNKTQCLAAKLFPETKEVVFLINADNFDTLTETAQLSGPLSSIYPSFLYSLAMHEDTPLSRVFCLHI